jgi:hypothetical protein
MAQIKKRDFWFWQGANHSDTGWYREDLQRRQGRKMLFYVPDSVKHCIGGGAQTKTLVRGFVGSCRGAAQPHTKFCKGLMDNPG